MDDTLYASRLGNTLDGIFIHRSAKLAVRELFWTLRWKNLRLGLRKHLESVWCLRFAQTSLHIWPSKVKLITRFVKMMLTYERYSVWLILAEIFHAKSRPPRSVVTFGLSEARFFLFPSRQNGREKCSRISSPTTRLCVEVENWNSTRTFATTWPAIRIRGSYSRVRDRWSRVLPNFTFTCPPDRDW